MYISKYNSILCILYVKYILKAFYTVGLFLVLYCHQLGVLLRQGHICQRLSYRVNKDDENFA